jgi:hypothetical protein
MVERWTKLSDAQARIGSIGSGMRCANVGVVDGSEVLGRGQSFLENALEEAERERNQLSDENSSLRRLVLNAVNEAQSVLHLTRTRFFDCEEEVGRHPTHPDDLLISAYWSRFPPSLSPLCSLFLLLRLRMKNSHLFSPPCESQCHSCPATWPIKHQPNQLLQMAT